MILTGTTCTEYSVVLSSLDYQCKFNPVCFRDVNVLIFLDFSFRYDSVRQKYERLKRYVAHYAILWYRVTLRNEFSALEYLIQR